jgi:YidC/Oxa1 family membrane protein insertase
MELQRTILGVIFAMTLVLLWDRWQVAHGHSAMFFPSAVAPASAPASAPGPGAAGVAGPDAGRARGDVPPAAASAAAPAAAPAAAASSAVPGDPGGAGSHVGGSTEIVRIETDVLRMDFDALGAVVTRAELLQQRVPTRWKEQGIAGFIVKGMDFFGVGERAGAKSADEQRVVLFDRAGGHEYTGRSGLSGTGQGGEALPNHVSHFEVAPGPRILAEGQSELRVRFESASGGVLLRKTFVFHRGHYDVEVLHEVVNSGSAPVLPTLYLELRRDGNIKSSDESSFASTYTGPAIYTEADHYKKLPFDDIKKAGEALPASQAQFPREVEKFAPTKSGWLAMVQHYFLTAWLPEPGPERVYYTRQISDNDFAVGAKIPLGEIAPGGTASARSSLFAGPQVQRVLEALAPGLDKVANTYAWLDPIAKPLFWLLRLLYDLVGNWGWAIVLLTILIKAAFYPLAAAGFKSMARMKEMAPRMEKLKQQYGDDKQRLQQAMMELYKKEKINPLGSCLPILVQIPVFIALYSVLMGSVEMRNASWILWIHDLATPDPWFVLPVIMMGTSWIQFKLNPTPPDPVQAKMMAAMPFIFGVMFFFFPSGLVLYYVLNNALSILQQWRINKVIAAGKAA